MKEKYISMERLFLQHMIKFFFLSIFFFYPSFINAESLVKAKDSLVWDSENKSYTALGSVEFKNDTFKAFSEKMVAYYIEKDNEEIFTKVELFENVRIELQDEVFLGDYAIYTRENNTIRLTGNVSIKSPTRLLRGNELIADIDNNKRILNSADQESLVEVLLDNNERN